MIDSLFSQPNYVAAKQLLRGTAMERVAIANNVANVETPGYHRMQLDPSFKQQLQSAVRNQQATELDNLSLNLEEDPNAVASRLDGNSVNLEQEMLQLMQNSVDHAFETQLLSGNLLRMRLAITGRS